ncbi:asparagine synthase (glutamine-hydrolyzing) [Magnetovibrio sp.]|uniref:asparagine synthase (glutamine-hydrolyzing) n=1 Tax=Magnetovibrio sp. TaxID=2024836 RepID=UPI002F95750C
MCGIAGLVGLSASSSPEVGTKADVVEHFVDSLAHRGPDGQGAYRNGPCVLVHTRLAIIDVEGGDQPFVARRDGGGDNEVALIANGEIYNNPELRAHMMSTPFASQSDCEPPLYLYLKHGLDYVDHLRGMYAIAIWDAAHERLVLSRDPFGIKNLYYAHTPHGFAFASEPRALIAPKLRKAQLNADKRDELLQLQFTTGADTAFAGIRRLEPGETIVVEKGEVVERRRRAALPAGGPQQISRNTALMELDRILNDVVGVHQRSDVPYGMFLSGGIDSSVLLAMMSRLNEQPVTAFTAGFTGTAVPDEREHARELARVERAHHIEVEFGEQDFWSELPRIVRHMDDPAADYAVLPTWKLAQTARAEGIKVVLAGEGGDELFGGYGRYRAAKRWLFPKEMYRKGIMDGLDVLIDADPARAWRAGVAQAGIEARLPGRTRLQVAQAQDIATWLPGDLLTKADRMLMAHGVEGRVPFLDAKLADFVFTWPDRLKIHHGLGKATLRHWLASAMPAARPFSKKRGFTVPVGEWIAGQGVRVGDLVAAQESIQAVCKPDAVRDLFAVPIGRPGKAAWTLLFYALWHKIHIEGVAPDGDVFDVLSA